MRNTKVHALLGKLLREGVGLEATKVQMEEREEEMLQMLVDKMGDKSPPPSEASSRLKPSGHGSRASPAPAPPSTARSSYASSLSVASLGSRR